LTPSLHARCGICCPGCAAARVALLRPPLKSGALYPIYPLSASRAGHLLRRGRVVV